MPSSITQTTVTPNIVDSFVYGPEHQRAKQVQSTGKTLYYAGAMEKEVVGSTTTVKTYLPNGIGVLIDNGSTVQTRYVHKDHLGSIAAITKEDGSPAEQMSYDPFGKRRNLDGTDDPGNALIGATGNKGYTGHEMLDNVALIHMNGRVYDPSVARFTTADPFVSNPDNPQSFNRYSYVRNNPLAYTDPTGYEGEPPVADSPQARNFVGITITATSLNSINCITNPAGCQYILDLLNRAERISPLAKEVLRVAERNMVRTTITAGAVALGGGAGLNPVADALAIVIEIGGTAYTIYAISSAIYNAATQPDQGADGDGEKALEAGAAAPPPEGDENKGDKQKKGKPERNVDQNKRVDDAAREAGLDKQQRRELGRFVEQESRKYGENFSYGDILDAAERLKAGERLIYIK